MRTSENPQKAKFAEFGLCEVQLRRIPRIRTSPKRRSKKKFISTLVHRSGPYLGPPEAAQHLFEGLRPDLDDPGEGIVELPYGEKYAADDERQGRDHDRVRHVAPKPEEVGERNRDHPAAHQDYPQEGGYAFPDLQ